MPYRFDISRIDENEELPDNDFENDEIDIDELGERDYYSATHLCNWCNGLDNYCAFCFGTGTIKRKY